MDPNATWNEMCDLADKMNRDGEEDESIDTGDAVRLAELTLALRDWMAKGGFPPKAFRK